jgi:hypothetical protein
MSILPNAANMLQTGDAGIRVTDPNEKSKLFDVLGGIGNG